MSEISRVRQKKELYKIIVAHMDITQALQTCDLILQHVDRIGNDLYFPLFHAAAVAYGRPFSQNKPLGPLAAKWRKYNDPMHQDIHQKLIEARNTYVAHSNSSMREVSIIPPGFVMSLGKTVGLGWHVKRYAYDLKFFKNVRATCFDLGSRLQNDILASLDVVYRDKALPTHPFPLTFDDDL